MSCSHAGSLHDLLSASRVAVDWTTRAPDLSIAVAVPAGVWDEYVANATESRTKAVLREGELSVPMIDAAAVEQTLTEAGAAVNRNSDGRRRPPALMYSSSNRPLLRLEPRPRRRRLPRKTTAPAAPLNNFFSLSWNHCPKRPDCSS